MLAIQVFAWFSYSIIVIGNVIIIYDFLEERIPIWRRKNDNNKQP